MRWKATIYGNPTSKSNTSNIAFNRKTGKTFVAKSKRSTAYIKLFEQQFPFLKPKQVMEGDVRVTMTIYYSSLRPDLDASQILDLLQDKKKRGKKGEPMTLVRTGVYHDDKQVKELHLYWGLDRHNPRCEITVEPMAVAAE